MSYEELIVAIAESAPQLKEAALRLLLDLVSLAIQHGTHELTVSSRDLATRTGLSREGVMRGARALAALIAVDVQHGRDLRFTLPAPWFATQRTLFPPDDSGPRIHSWPTNQATTGQRSWPLLANQPGQNWPTNQASLPTNLASTGQPTRPIGQPTRPDWPTNQASSDGVPIRNAGARVDRSIDIDFADADLIGRVDRAVEAVHIEPDQQEAAALLRSSLQAYRDAFPGHPGLSDRADDIVVAHILAIADVEELCRVLRTLYDHAKAPGSSDMWFFFVLMEKIHGVKPALTRSRMELAKAKARTYESKPSLWHEDLVKATAAKTRRLA